MRFVFVFLLACLPSVALADAYSDAFAKFDHVYLGEDATVGASTTVTDEVGSANGTLAGGDNTEDIDAAGPTAWIPYSLHLDNVADEIDVTSAVIPTGSSDRTLCIWINSDQNSSGTNEPFLLQYTAGGSGANLFFYYEDNAISVGYNGHRIISPKSTLSTGTWYHVALVVDTATDTGDPTLYINGSAQTVSDETGSAQTLNTGGSDPEIGTSSGGQLFDGKVAQVAFSDQAFTAAEVLAIYEGPSSGPALTILHAIKNQ